MTMASRPSFQYQPPKVDSGKLRIPIHFYAQDAGDSPEPTDIERTIALKVVTLRNKK